MPAEAGIQAEWVIEKMNDSETLFFPGFPLSRE
jgi:hypothetical protein